MVAMFLKENPAEIVWEPIVGPSSGCSVKLRLISAGLHMVAVRDLIVQRVDGF